MVAEDAVDTKNAQPIVRLSGVNKIYQRGDEELHVLDQLSLEIPRGCFEAFMGPSGSGKSTLLHLIAGLDKPTSGAVEVAGARLDQLNDGQLTKFRAATIGFIFQSFNLLPVLTALENVELPLLLAPVSSSERRKRAETALRVVGLGERMSHYPRQLSGGQEQRVAIARAIVSDPQIVVADEPTGDLDRKSADDVLEILQRLQKEMGKTILMVTHDPAAAERAGRLHRLDKGRLT